MRTIKFYKYLFFAWIIAASFDLYSAFLINYRLPAERVCRYIASGVYGTRAFTGPNEMIWFGVLFHYLIAYVWAALWFTCYPTVIRYLKHPLIAGVLFGAVTWLVMTFLVVPHSNIPQPKHGMTLLGIITGMGALIICIGIPVALFADHYFAMPDKKK